MYPEFGVPVSYAGGISVVIAAGTVISSLMSDRLTRRISAGTITAVSVGMTALALFGFSVSRSYIALILWAIPYGLGAGSVDASLNNYVALHYASRHMSWLHCMWGLGASVGPYIMGYALTGGLGWSMGYRYIALMQMVLTAVLLLSLPLWKRRTDGAGSTGGEHGGPLSLRQIVKIPGARAVMLTFFCYCAAESTVALWASSYLVLYQGIAEETAARFASLFYLGITLGRALSGFLTLRFSDEKMVRLGESIIFLGLVAMVLPLGELTALAGLVLIGLGCAPVYPSLIHATPAHFGADRSQAIIGVQMASAYVGTCLMPPLFGVLANHITVALLPWYLALIVGVMTAMHEVLCRRTRTVEK